MQAVLDVRQTLAAMLPKGGIGAEIGVFRGGYSRRIFAEAKPKRLFLVDPWRNSDQPEHARALYAQGGGNEMEEIHAAVTQAFSVRPYVGRVEVVRSMSAPWLASLDDAALDFVYIDGDHTYAAVREDLTLAVAKTRPDGMIGLDDYSLGQWWGDGVVRAVHEALATLPLMIAFAAEGQVALRRL